METIQICCLLVLLVQTCLGYTYTGNVSECTTVTPGETIQRLGQCEECVCTKPYASCNGCGVFHRGPLTQEQLDQGCYVEKPDKTLMYPDCCLDKVVCPEKAPLVANKGKENVQLVNVLKQLQHLINSQNTKQKWKTISMVMRLIRNMRTA